MKKTLLLVLILVVSCGQNSSQESASNSFKTSSRTEEEKVIKAAILGGKDVEEIDPIYHSTVALTDNKGLFQCSATLISENLVLTAAHCVTGWKKRFLLGPKRVEIPGTCVAFGDYHKDPSNIICATEIIFHPAKDPNDAFNKDIAVIKINDKIPDGFKPVAILDGSFQLETDTPLIAAGYGAQVSDKVDPYGNKKYGYLKKADVTFLNLVGSFALSKQDNGVYGATFGDSGGPLYIDTHNDELLLVGSVTGGNAGEKFAKNTYTALFKQFVLESAKKLNATKPIFKNPISE